MDSLWVDTCSSLKRGHEPEWDDVKDYREPLLLLLRSFQARGLVQDPEDIVQDILIDIKERLYERYNPHRGPFRAYLQGVLQFKLRQQWRERRRASKPLENVPEPMVSEEQSRVVDIIADILGAVRAWHDRCAHGPRRDRQRVYVLSGRMILNLNYAQIAEREGISESLVKRILQQVREEILGGLLQRSLGLDQELRAGLDWAQLGATVRTVLAQPGSKAAVLAELADPVLRRALDLWLDVHLSALRRLPGEKTRTGGELRHGLEVIFGPTAMVA